MGSRMHAATMKAGPNMHIPMRASPRRAWHGLIQYSSIVVNIQASVSEMFSVSRGLMSTAPRYGGEGAMEGQGLEGLGEASLAHS